MFQSQPGGFQGFEGQRLGSGVGVIAVGGEPDAIGLERLSGSVEQEQGEELAGEGSEVGGGHGGRGCV